MCMNFTEWQVNWPEQAIVVCHKAQLSVQCQADRNQHQQASGLCISQQEDQFKTTVTAHHLTRQLSHKWVYSSDTCTRTHTIFIIKLEVLREHKPPPIRRIRISDFGLPDPKRDPDRHQHCITWSLSHALPLQKISSKSVHKFASNPMDRQTDKQTNRPNQKHNLLFRRR